MSRDIGDTRDTEQSTSYSFKKVIRKMKTNNICFLKVIHWCLLSVSKHAQIVCPRAQPKKMHMCPRARYRVAALTIEAEWLLP